MRWPTLDRKSPTRPRRPSRIQKDAGSWSSGLRNGGRRTVWDRREGRSPWSGPRPVDCMEPVTRLKARPAPLRSRLCMKASHGAATVTERAAVSHVPTSDPRLSSPLVTRRAESHARSADNRDGVRGDSGHRGSTDDSQRAGARDHPTEPARTSLRFQPAPTELRPYLRRCNTSGCTADSIADGNVGKVDCLAAWKRHDPESAIAMPHPAPHSRIRRLGAQGAPGGSCPVARRRRGPVWQGAPEAVIQHRANAPGLDSTGSRLRKAWRRHCG